MRVGLSSNFIEPALCRGKFDGIGTFTSQLYQELQTVGTTVVPVVFPSFKNLRPRCELPEVNRMPLPYSLSAALSAFTQTSALGSRRLQDKIDLYHCTDYLIPRLKNIPVIAMVHDAVKVQFPDWNSSRFRGLKTYGLMRAIPWADHYIAPSQAVVPELVEHFGIEEKNISVVHNAIAAFWFEKQDAETKQAVLNHYGLRPGFLLYTGTFQPRKNIERLLAAFKSLPVAMQKEHPLVLVGQRGWIAETVIQDIQNLMEKGSVRWLNHINTAELRALYQSAALFLFPSLHEGFGLPILEAFASETPVLTGNRAAMPEVAGDAACLVDPYSVESIREGILALLQDTEKRQALTAKGSQRVLDFSWKKCREAVLEVYRKVL